MSGVVFGFAFGVVAAYGYRRLVRWMRSRLRPRVIHHYIEIGEPEWKQLFRDHPEVAHASGCNAALTGYCECRGLPVFMGPRFYDTTPERDRVTA
jgi:hypothetical protein